MPVKCCAKGKALKAVVQAIAMAVDQSRFEMTEACLSGTHLFRVLAGTVTGLARWDETEAGAKQADILGDWADRNTARGSGKRPVIAARAGAKPSSRSSYKANASIQAQMEARTRYVRMMQAAFQAFGEDNVSWETTWLDLFPPSPPAALARFYGEQLPEDREWGEVDPQGGLAHVSFSRRANVSSGEGEPRASTRKRKDRGLYLAGHE